MASMYSFPLDVSQDFHRDSPPGEGAGAAQAARMRSLDAVAASIAHEVRQPLAAIALNADAALRWLDRDPPGLEQARAALALVAGAASHAGAVLRSVQGLAGTAHGSDAICVADDAVHDMLQLLRAELLCHAIHVEIALAPGRAPLRADPVQVRQLILNLLMNAVDTLRDTGGRQRSVLLSSRCDGGMQHFSIADNGAGIAPQAAGRLYEALYSSKPGGMGLGLAICRRIVDTHGGRLWHAPGAPHGSVFHFTLPSC